MNLSSAEFAHKVVKVFVMILHGKHNYVGKLHVITDGTELFENEICKLIDIWILTGGQWPV